MLSHWTHRTFLPPDAFDTELMKQTFMEIVEGKVVKIPVYDFKTSSRYTYNIILRGIPITVTPAI